MRVPNPQKIATLAADDLLKPTPARSWTRRLNPYALFAALFAAGCSPSATLNGLAPRNGYDLTQSIRYGDAPRQFLDVYRPLDVNGAPVVVFFYGGSWQGGSKDSYRFVAATLARRGIVTILPDYRVYPDVRFPAFIEDGASAVGWARANAVRFGGDPEKIVVMGHSAGAHIAAMLAIDDRWLAAEGLDPRRDLAGLVGLAGPYDFLPIQNETLKIIFGGDSRPETQPITFVKGNEPPSLLMTGPNDDTVDPGNTSRLAARLRAVGSQVEIVVPPSVGHVTIVGAIAWPLRFLGPVLDDVYTFVRDVTAGNGRSSRTRDLGS